MHAITRHPHGLAAWVTVFTLLLPAAAGAQSLRGSVFVEARLFPNAPAFPDQRDVTASPSLVLEPEWLWESRSGNRQVRIAPFVRFDAHDPNRTHFDLREAGVLFLSDRWTVFAGVGKVFWGKTEAHHLVDIVNQTDGVEDIDGEDKLGQPMVNATLEFDSGAVDVFLFPVFRERTYAGDRGRLRGPLPLAGDAVYDADAGRWHQDVAVRLSWFVGEIDLGVSAFRGTSREPRLVPVTIDARSTLRPHYDLIDQVSIDAQWTRGATLWKLEALTRGGHGARFGATTFGLEHTFFNLGPGAADLGVLGEVMLDGRDATAPIAVFDHDVFVGARWAFNDVSDTSLLGGPVVDYRTGEVVTFVEIERRFGDRWRVGLEGRWLLNTEHPAPLHGLRQDDVLTLWLSRYF